MTDSERGFSRDMARIRGISSQISARLSKTPHDELDGLSAEELQDLDRIVAIADFVLCKYADKKEMRATLGEFVSMISETARSLGDLDDEISELILSAEDSISRVRDIHANISKKSSLGRGYGDGPEYGRHETGAINLTNIATELNTVEYQQNLQGTA